MVEIQREMRPVGMPHLYELTETAGICTPALVVYPRLVEQNVARAVELVGDPARLRPHAKTHKTREVTRMQLAAGVAKHKCATVAEAEMLAGCGVPDVLLAYPVVGPNAHRVAALARAFPGTRFSVLVDHPNSVAAASAAAVAHGVTLGVLVDLDVGQHRTGIPIGNDAADLYLHAARMPGLSANGFHAYDGHNTTEPRAEREANARANIQAVRELKAIVESRGVPVPRLIAGGTPPFPIYAAMKDLPELECSPGTYVFHDHNYQSKFPDFSGITPAAVLVTRVVSRPTGNRVTFDVGTKAVASDPPAGKRLALLDLPDAVPVGHNEEHYIVETPHAHRFQPGDIAYAIPAHVCPTVALHKELLVAENGIITGSWTVAARDRMLTF
jgi:D-serine deaminase-like pyridoxal phosphate-dependent protein